MRGTSFMGSHRTGKTTLAKAYAEKHGIKFIPMSVAPAYEACGIPMGPVSFKDRMKIQDEAMMQYIENLEFANAPFITDRCFLDLLAYTLADYPQAPTEEESAWFREYCKKCRELTYYHFNTVVLIRPGIPIEKCGTSWAADGGVIAQVDACMLWAAEQTKGIRQMPKYISQHEMRLAHLEVLINESKL
jgi:hypothetical protein